MIRIVYYAHSMEIYDTRREEEEMQRLEDFFSPYHALIFNPNRHSIQQSREPMRECLRIIKQRAITDFVFSHESRRIPLGVYREIQFAQKYRKRIWIMSSSEIHEYAGKTKEIKKTKNTNWARV